jgi:hypothetical protein
MKEKEKTGKSEVIKMTCGPENVKFFSQTLKEKALDIHALVKALYEAELIVGLRGIKLEIGIEPQVAEEKPVEAKKTANFCKQCSQWEKDSLGDDMGGGTCLINAMPKLIKWPNTPACQKYTARKAEK